MTFRVPLGVTAGITPFNFPAMIPLWVRNEPTLYLTPNVCSLRWLTVVAEAYQLG